MKDHLTIGAVAKKSGVNLQTIRYYERRGLLTPDSRSEAGYRLYAPEVVKIIRFIKNAQELGFSLEEIGRLLRLRVGRKVQCVKVRKQALDRLGIVRGKIAALRAMEKVLQRLIRTCAARGTTESCPILESLEEQTR